jgi:hypothetical protein
MRDASQEDHRAEHASAETSQQQGTHRDLRQKQGDLVLKVANGAAKIGETKTRALQLTMRHPRTYLFDQRAQITTQRTDAILLTP